MSMNNFPNRTQIDNAGDIDMNQTRTEKPANITIEVTPAGLVIKAEYTGTLSSIPTAIERLRQAGVLDLVERSAPAPAAAHAHPDTSPSCPIHHTPMKPMEKPDKSGKTHWCTKKTGEGFCKERA